MVIIERSSREGLGMGYTHHLFPYLTEGEWEIQNGVILKHPTHTLETLTNKDYNALLFIRAVELKDYPLYNRFPRNILGTMNVWLNHFTKTDFTSIVKFITHGIIDCPRFIISKEGVLLLEQLPKVSDTDLILPAIKGLVGKGPTGFPYTYSSVFKGSLATLKVKILQQLWYGTLFYIDGDDISPRSLRLLWSEEGLNYITSTLRSNEKLMNEASSILAKRFTVVDRGWLDRLEQREFHIKEGE